MAWVLVTPSSRGIGLALVQRLLLTTPAGVSIVATARSNNLAAVREEILSTAPSAISEDLTSRLDVQSCDLLSEQSIEDLASYCRDRYQPDGQGKAKSSQSSLSSSSSSPPPHLRLGLFIPGMLQPERSPQQIDYETALATLKLNLLSPMLLIKHFSAFLPGKASKTAPAIGEIPGLNGAAILAIMSARVGSITDNVNAGGWYSYRSSKAGVNQLVRTLDNYLKLKSGDRAMSVALHPGTVKTGLSKEFWKSTPKEKLFEPAFAAERLCEVLEGLEVEKGRGRCWDWKGQEIPP